MPLRLTLLTAVLAGALFLTTAGPAAATSCAVDEATTPEAIASGTAPIEGGFFARWDFAVIGTVTAIRTDERQGSPTYGATEIDLRVAGVLGTATAPATTTLRSPDPGWMSGYPFELGVAYFVPVVARSPEGIVNSTFLCDPISSLADADDSAAALGALAATSGIPFAAPITDAPVPPGGSGAGSDASTTWFVPAASATAVLAAVGSLVVLWRRPLRPGHDLIVVRGGDERLQRGPGPS